MKNNQPTTPSGADPRPLPCNHSSVTRLTTIENGKVVGTGLHVCDECDETFDLKAARRVSPAPPARWQDSAAFREEIAELLFNAPGCGAWLTPDRLGALTDVLYSRFAAVSPSAGAVSAEDRDAVIEECAMVCDRLERECSIDRGEAANAIFYSAERIRALKSAAALSRPVAPTPNRETDQ